MKKFMQTLDERVYGALEKLASDRGISVQELLRAIIIPEWLSEKDLSLAAAAKEVSERFAGPGKGEEKE